MTEHKSRYELFLEEEEKKPERRCSKCGQVKPITDFYKHRHSSGTWGHKSQCKPCHMGPKKYKSQADRFWKFFHSRTQKVGTCLEWKGTCRNGVPSFNWDRKATNVRRIVYRLACGELPDDMFVIATCRKKRCVLQSHLKRVTQEELDIFVANSAATGDQHGSRIHPECLRRGENHPARIHPERLARGERANQSKLKDSDIHQIRRLGSNRELPQRTIADRYGITQRAVWQIVHRKTWTHIPWLEDAEQKAAAEAAQAQQGAFQNGVGRPMMAKNGS